METTSALEQFMTIYTEELDHATKEHPADYPWAHTPTVIHGNCGDTVLPPCPVAQVAAKMRLAILHRSYSHNGHAFKSTCKRLGIKHTRQAIEAFCFGTDRA